MMICLLGTEGGGWVVASYWPGYTLTSEPNRKKRYTGFLSDYYYDLAFHVNLIFQDAYTRICCTGSRGVPQ